MEHGNVESHLFVVCRGDEQKAEVKKRFKDETPGNSSFCMREQERYPYRIKLDFQSCAFLPSLEDDILALSQWLETNFGLKIQGYWLATTDLEYRGEVLDGEILYTSLNWLRYCTIEHIAKLRKIAEERFPADFKQE